MNFALSAAPCMQYPEAPSGRSDGMKSRRFPTIPALAVSAALLTVLLASPLPAAASSPAAAASAATWAYGAVKTVDFHGTTDLGLWTYQGSATWGFAVVVNETNLSGSNYQLNVTRTMGVLLDVTYCEPNCANPVAQVNLSHHAWESVNATVNLTTAGSVQEPNGSVPALALNSSQFSVTGRLRESASYVLRGVLERSKLLDVNVTAQGGVVFSPALGLLPTDLTPGATWYSNSTFAGHGNYSWAIYLHGSVLLVPYTYTDSGSGMVNRSGTVNLSGSDGNPSVTLAGGRYSQVNYTLTGPFALREGFVLVPAGANLFGGSQPWAANESGNATISSPTVDVADHGFVGGHLGFVASGTWWSSSSSNIALDDTTGPGMPAASATPAADSGGSEFVQGVPESAQQAHASQACLATGVGCPLASSPRGPWGAVLVIGAGVVVVGLLVAVVATRRRIPPPAYPNAALYPPGQTSTVPPRAGPPTARPPAKPPAEDDPLSHLW